MKSNVNEKYEFDFFSLKRRKLIKSLLNKDINFFFFGEKMSHYGRKIIYFIIA